MTQSRFRASAASVCRRGGRRALIVCLAALLSVSPTILKTAAAQTRSLVVLLRDPGDDELMRQGSTLLAAELRTIGFDVAPVQRDPRRDIRQEIGDTSARLQPVATLAILPAPGGAAVELWLEDRITGKLVIRRMAIARTHDAAADLALKAVELLRGSLVEITVAHAPGQEPPAPPADVARWLAATPHRLLSHFARGLGLSAGAGILNSGARLGLAYTPVLRVSWGSADGWVSRLTLRGPGSSGDVTAAEGSATLHRDLAFLDGGRVFRLGSRWQPIVAAGAGVMHVRGEGVGISPLFPGRERSSWAAAGGLGGGVALRLGNRVALLLEATALLLVPATKVTISDREVARVGALSQLLDLTVVGAF